MSTTVVFTYKVTNQPRMKTTKTESPSAFDRLRGIAKTLFKDSGGWERSIQKDRQDFYRKADNERKRKLG